MVWSELCDMQTVRGRDQNDLHDQPIVFDAVHVTLEWDNYVVKSL